MHRSFNHSLTWSWLLLQGVTGVFVVQFIACTIPSPDGPKNVLVVFDPTILLRDDSLSLDIVLEDLRSALSTLPQGTRIWVRTVRLHMINNEPVYERTLKVFRGTSYKKNHQEEADSVATEVVEILRRKWKLMHEGKRPGEETSCIRTALFVASEDLANLKESSQVNRPGNIGDLFM